MGVVSILLIVVSVVCCSILSLNFPSWADGPCPSDSVCPDDAYFSSSYFEAREKFKSSAQLAKFGLSSYEVLKDPATGLSLTIDVAVKRASKPNASLLVHISGTHGVEGYVGSAIQVQQLAQHGLFEAAFPDDISVVLVHALNPFGFANNRRFNENNVDLNRNDLTDAEWKEVLSRDPNVFHYDDVSHLINPKFQSWVEYVTFPFFALPYGLLRLGFARVKAALVTGQYHNPAGLYFGGTERQKSIEILQKIIDTHAQHVDRALLVDVHSGLGPSGLDTLMVDSVEDTKLTKRVMPKHSRIEGPDGGDVTAGYSNSKGFIVVRLPKPGAHSLRVTQEFGTVPGVMVASAMILENAAYHQRPRSYHHMQTLEFLKSVFFVQTRWWRQTTLQRGKIVFEEAFEALRQPW